MTNRSIVVFPAKPSGRTLLQTSHDSLSAFMTHRLRIEACITDLIRQGRFEEDETIVMRSHDMR